MTRARLASAAAIAALAGCGKTSVTVPGVGFSRPSSIAVFRGITLASGAVLPYFAVANAVRSDLTLVNANDDKAVLAPIQIRSLAVPVQFRPTILVAARLGDDGVDANQKPIPRPDLLVAIAADSGASSGSSSLQLVRTWNAVNDVVDAQTVEVPGEVLAAVPVPSPSGTTGKARLALALSERRIAIVQYRRSGDGTDAIEIDASAPAQVLTLAVQPASLAASDDGAHLYAATLDEVAPGVFGVAEVAIDAVSGAPTFSRAIDARGPTRLVAFARLKERVTGSAASAAVDSTAFAAQDPVPRVYAVLDESGCGTSHRIDCGVAVLDVGAGGVRADVSGRMPYLAPIPLPARPLAIAVAFPPSKPPIIDTTDVLYDSLYRQGLMRLWPASGTVATTAVAAVPCDDGRVYFLDLARWKVANDRNAPSATLAGVQSSTPITVPAGGTVRLSLARGDGHVLTQEEQAVSGFDPVPDYVAAVPGYTRDDVLTVAYQGALPALSGLRAQAGQTGGTPWLAMQGTPGPMRLWDPSLGVRVNDVVQIDASGLSAVAPACAGTEAPGAEAGTKKVFEARVSALLPPSAEHPGGALQLTKETAVPVPPPPGDSIAPWDACFDALVAATASGPVSNLTASILAGGYVLGSSRLGHLGRPEPLQAWPTAAYDADEATPGGTPALTCPLVPWPENASAVTCDDTTCRTTCQVLLTIRKMRRQYHVAETCPASDTACNARFAALALPDAGGPPVRFTIAIDAQGGAAATARRGLSLTITTSGGVSPFSAPPSGTSNLGSLTHPAGVSAFDRTESGDASSGYRFLVPYVGDWVLDTSPSVQNAASGVIR